MRAWAGMGRNGQTEYLDTREENSGICCVESVRKFKLKTVEKRAEVVSE